MGSEGRRPAGLPRCGTGRQMTSSRPSVYLEGKSVATVQVPGGRYRLVVANGEEWRGDEALFGRNTEYF